MCRKKSASGKVVVEGGRSMFSDVIRVGSIVGKLGIAGLGESSTDSIRCFRELDDLAAVVGAGGRVSEWQAGLCAKPK